MDDITSIGKVRMVANKSEPRPNGDCSSCTGCACPCWPTQDTQSGVWGATGIVVWSWVSSYNS